MVLWFFLMTDSQWSLCSSPCSSHISEVERDTKLIHLPHYNFDDFLTNRVVARVHLSMGIFRYSLLERRRRPFWISSFLPGGGEDGKMGCDWIWKSISVFYFIIKWLVCFSFRNCSGGREEEDMRWFCKRAVAAIASLLLNKWYYFLLGIVHVSFTVDCLWTCGHGKGQLGSRKHESTTRRTRYNPPPEKRWRTVVCLYIAIVQVLESDDFCSSFPDLQSVTLILPRSVYYDEGGFTGSYIGWD